MTQRAIVLAAGTGSRLASYMADDPAGAPRPLGEALPKPLKPVASVPLLVRILRTLQSEGVREACVVVGYQGGLIRDALSREPSLGLRLHFVENHDYLRKNGMSVLAAKEFIGHGCLLTMADHLYSPEIVRRLRSYELPADAALLAVDHDIERCFDLDDATKVQVGRGRVVEIGKELPSYNALDTGVFRVGPALVRELERVFEATGDCSLSDGVGALARAGRMFACAIGDARWIDVDTPEAAQRAEAMVQVLGDALGDEPPAAARRTPEAVEAFAPSWVRAAPVYGEAHFELAAEQDELTRLMANESPFRPSPRVIEAIVGAALQGNVYPVGERELREKIAARETLAAEQVLLGAGAVELIDLAIRTFVAPGEEVLLSAPTSSMYESRTRTAGGIPVHVPLRDDVSLDANAIVAAITERTKLLFVCSPGALEGQAEAEADLRQVLSLGLPTAIDESYVEFAEGQGSAAFLLAEFPNAFVVRTFSKAFGLAGLRVGYALGHRALVRLLGRVKVPWSVSSLAIAAAAAALDEVELARERVASLRRERAELEGALRGLPGLAALPGDANFVIVDVGGTGLTADAVVQRMVQGGVLVRSLAAPRAQRQLLRITVGDAAQNQHCVAALREALPRASDASATARARTA